MRLLATGLALLAIGMAGRAGAATLDVMVTGVRNAQGEIRVAVCAEGQFLQMTCDHVGHAPAHVGDVLVRVTGVPPGVWAVQAFHDEDGDGKIGRNLLGIPTEGLGFSNDARFKFGPPGFNDAAFQLSPAGGVIRLSLRYF